MQQKCHGKVNASGCTAVPVRDGRGYHSKNPQGALTVRRLVQSGASGRISFLAHANETLSGPHISRATHFQEKFRTEPVREFESVFL